MIAVGFVGRASMDLLRRSLGTSLELRIFPIKSLTNRKQVNWCWLISLLVLFFQSISQLQCNTITSQNLSVKRKKGRRHDWHWMSQLLKAMYRPIHFRFRLLLSPWKTASVHYRNSFPKMYVYVSITAYVITMNNVGTNSSFWSACFCPVLPSLLPAWLLPGDASVGHTVPNVSCAAPPPGPAPAVSRGGTPAGPVLVWPCPHLCRTRAPHLPHDILLCDGPIFPENICNFICSACSIIKKKCFLCNRRTKTLYFWVIWCTDASNATRWWDKDKENKKVSKSWFE